MTCLRLVLFASVVCVGCQTPQPVFDTHAVATRLDGRIHQRLPDSTSSGTILLPPGVSFADGLTEDEAVAIALWNNAAFQTLLADLGVAHSDLVQAGLLPNPEFVYFLRVPDKPLKYALDFPLEALWLRPVRLKNATHEMNRTTERITQAGLDLMRDVRAAYADLLFAKERQRIATEAVQLRSRIAELAQKRLEAGDISTQEATTATIDALQAQQDAVRSAFDIPLAEERLRHVMGINTSRQEFILDPTSPVVSSTIDINVLIQEACMQRPDFLAANEAVSAAETRFKFAQLSWVRLLGIADATSGKNGHEFGPAARVTVPLFNRNEGGLARAEADLEQAKRQRQTITNQIVLDVRRAHLQHQQTCRELNVLRSEVQPKIATALRQAQGAYAEGNITIFVVLEATRQRLDTELREAQLTADLRRFWAELERSVGRKIAVPADPEPTIFATERSDLLRPIKVTKQRPGFASERGNP